MQADMNWFGVLAHHASLTPDKPMVVFGDQVVTYAQMAAQAGALAAGMHDRGIGAGDVVALLSYNSPEFLETIFAANYLGAIAMPINWRLAAPEVRYVLEHSEARALVCDGALVPLGDAATTGIEDRLYGRVRRHRPPSGGSRSQNCGLRPTCRPRPGSPATTSTGSCTPRGRPVARRA